MKAQLMEVDVHSLILTLEGRTELFLTPEGLPNKRLRIRNQVTTLPSFPPWPVCADLLVSWESRAFVGLTYPVDKENEDLVRNLGFRFTGVGWRYNDLTSDVLRVPYSDDDQEIHRLEIFWTDIPADTMLSAQLDSGMWYYVNESDQDIRVIAFGLTDIDTVLAEYGLIFPTPFDVPRFLPEFVD